MLGKSQFFSSYITFNIHGTRLKVSLKLAPLASLVSQHSSTIIKFICRVSNCDDIILLSPFQVPDICQRNGRCGKSNTKINYSL